MVRLNLTNKFRTSAVAAKTTKSTIFTSLPRFNVQATTAKPALAPRKLNEKLSFVTAKPVKTLYSLGTAKTNAFAP
ncbi:unnamed protein product [Aphanomyces euteiches]|uniref:Uncharacterized protein n=1 Tax=Aphanomyces euteiches TaxID=100861 RepID=A0A6G0XG38_9STRA|nr:hypothetical protein Ae201684_005165 [Aphanomyces euteiches]KAH9080734.1 hypothetical protein Ae201684P_012874 [Aphanomyces euteiches]KAH9088444.1 hypothetical protein LEN26_019492 [Aphanomyces euteiches]KAH9115927.1 hypothetical protein AeMF1_010074 [Aphanomyces euteiches]KAH9155639.1 hypothetical protein AeRB84_002402 [Aphanomyces euteiches]